MMFYRIAKRLLMAENKKAAKKKSAVKKKTEPKKKSPAKKKSGLKENKLGVKNSLVNNINAKKKKGTSKPKSKSTIDKKQYDRMEQDWK